MVSNTEANKVLEDLHNKIFNSSRIVISQELKWLTEIPNNPGVYLIFERENLCYVGETADLKKRMADLFRTVNHTFRRKVGMKYFKDHVDFWFATSSKPFHENIEALLNRWMVENIQISFLPVFLGRKELEERICKLAPSGSLYNRPFKRTSSL